MAPNVARSFVLQSTTQIRTQKPCVVRRTNCLVVIVTTLVYLLCPKHGLTTHNLQLATTLTPCVCVASLEHRGAKLSQPVHGFELFAFATTECVTLVAMHEQGGLTNDGVRYNNVTDCDLAVQELSYVEYVHHSLFVN